MTQKSLYFSLEGARGVSLQSFRTASLSLCLENVKITKQPQSCPITVGDRLELKCEATGVPKPEYLWFKAASDNKPRPLPNHKESILLVEEVDRSYTGRYCCRAMNKYGSEFSHWVEVIVSEPPAKLGEQPEMQSCISSDILGYFILK